METKLLVGGGAGLAVATVLVLLGQPMVAVVLIVLGAGAYLYVRQREMRAEGELLADLDLDEFDNDEAPATDSLSTWSFDAEGSDLQTWDPDSADSEPLGTWEQASSAEDPLASFGGLDEPSGGTDLLDEPELFENSPFGTFDPDTLEPETVEPAADDPLADPFADPFADHLGQSTSLLDDSVEPTIEESAPSAPSNLFSVPAPIDENLESDDDIMRASEATELAIDTDGGEDSELARLLLKVQARLSAYD